MMLTSVHGSVAAQNQTAAAMQASSLAELILMNPASTGHYFYPTMENGGNCFSTEACSSAAWAAGNLARWQQELEQSLAGATGLVCRDATPEDGHATDPACDGNGRTLVKVFWFEPGHMDDDDQGRRRFVLPVAE